MQCIRRSPGLLVLIFKKVISLLWLAFRGTLIQIWKSLYVFVFIWKQNPKNFVLLILRTLKFIPMKFVNFKIRLIFILFYSFWMSVNKLFMWRRRHWQVFRLVYLQICISVPWIVMTFQFSFTGILFCSNLALEKNN